MYTVYAPIYCANLPVFDFLPKMYSYRNGCHFGAVPTLRVYKGVPSIILAVAFQLTQAMTISSTFVLLKHQVNPKTIVKAKLFKMCNSNAFRHTLFIYISFYIISGDFWKITNKDHRLHLWVDAFWNLYRELGLIITHAGMLRVDTRAQSLSFNHVMK